MPDTTKDRTDEDVRKHNLKQKALMEDLFERERWILGNQISRDPRDHWADMAILEARVVEIIRAGFGEWMAEQIQDKA